MRLIPFLTAVIVCLVLYLLVMERDRLFAFATVDETAQAAEIAPAQPETEAPRRVRVVALTSQARTIDSAVILRGETRAARTVEVRAETSGQVVSEPLRKGAFVQAGQELCKIDPGTRAAARADAEARLAEARARVPESEARVAQAEAQLREAELNAANALKLSQDGYASETRVAATKAALSVAQAALASATTGLASVNAGIQAAESAVAAAQKELDRLTISAPFAGLLESDTAELGSLLQPGALCATVIQLDPIKLVGFVPETEVGRVAVGALAGGRLTDGRELRGRVTFLSRSADQTTRTFRVEIDVPNADLAVRDGQTAEILIAADGATAHLVPGSALTLNDGGDLGLRVVDADHIVGFVPVTLLRDTAQGVWVSGLPETVDIITVGQEYVTEGVKVDVTYAEAGQ